MGTFDYFMGRYPELASQFKKYREIHYHKENKTNLGKQIEFSAESNQFDKKIKSGNK